MRSIGVFLFLALSSAGADIPSSSQPRTGNAQIEVERRALRGGAELITIFASRSLRPGEHPGEEKVPLVSVLRDTLDHAGSERLRDVWVLTYARASIGENIAAALPFYYFRAGAGNVPEGRVPKPILNLSQPAVPSFFNLAAMTLQGQVFDGGGIFWRAPTRGYRANATEYRSMRVAEALQLIQNIQPDTPGRDLLSPEEWDQLQARLSLSRKLLGGLVSENHLERAAEREDRQLELNRGHNWELLRQAAEFNGLRFEPLLFGQNTPSYALLWISQADLASDRRHEFQGPFLKISNPWTDGSLRQWKGYTQDGRIPLALYSLDYPPSPLLMVDFRDEWKAKRKEIAGRAADYTATGILGFTGFGHIGYLIGKASFNWFRHRHGENVDRTARSSAYAELRHALSFDDALDPKLRADLEKRVDHLSLNPFERDQKNEILIARRQYAALMAYADNPDGIARLLDRERGREAVPLMENPRERALHTTAAVASLGIYRPREPVTPAVLARIDRQRQLESDIRYLNRVLASGPQIDVAWNLDEVNRRLDEIAALKPTGKELDSGLAELIGKVFAQTRDVETRRRCLNCLALLNSGGSRRQLQRFANDESVPSDLRTLAGSGLE